MPRVLAAGDDDRISDARVRRGGRAARRRAGVRDRPVPRARRSLAGPARFRSVSTTKTRSVAAIVEAARAAADRRRPRRRRSADGDRRARRRRRSGCRAIRPTAAAIARNKQLTRERLRDAGLPVPWFRRASARTRIPRRSRRRLAFPVCRQAGRAVGQPRRDARRRRRRSSSPRSSGCARCCSRPRSAPSGTTRTTTALRRGVHPRPRVRARRTAAPRRARTCWPSSTSPIRSTARSSRRPSTSRRLVGAGGRAGGDRRGRRRAPRRRSACAHGPIHAECRVNDDGVFVLEVAARPIGGLCARALRFDRRTGRRAAVR